MSSNLIPSAKVFRLVFLIWVTGWAVCCGVLTVKPGFAARADRLDRRHLDLVLSVLRAAPNEAGAACLASMRTVHRLERGQTATPEELEFSYQNASQLCGADAERVCRVMTQMPDRTVCRRLDGVS